MMEVGGGREGVQNLEMGCEKDVSLGDVCAPAHAAAAPSASAWRWSLLGRFISSRKAGLKADGELKKVSRRPAGRFNVVQCSSINPILEDGSSAESRRDMVVQYIIPSNPDVRLTLRQRSDTALELNDFTVSQRHDVDSTGLVCLWPAEEVLTHYCVSRPELCKNKKVIELGAGYGLAGLAIAACTEASEVLITDGNPQVIECIPTILTCYYRNRKDSTRKFSCVMLPSSEHAVQVLTYIEALQDAKIVLMQCIEGERELDIEANISANSGVFGDTKVSTHALHWSRHQAAMPGLTFDLVVAADCTFFKDFHLDLAHTIKGLLGTSAGCQAILFNPRRGDTLHRFLKVAQSVQLHVEVEERYDSRIWDLHQGFVKNEPGSPWANYDEDHCYPLRLSITHCDNHAPTSLLQDRV